MTAGPFEDLGALSRDDAAAKLRELDGEIASIGARNPDPIADHARSSSMPSACWEGLSTSSQKSNEGKEPHRVPILPNAELSTSQTSSMIQPRKPLARLNINHRSDWCLKANVRKRACLLLWK
jgi:hypothetical protein